MTVVCLATNVCITTPSRHSLFCRWWAVWRRWPRSTPTCHRHMPTGEFCQIYNGIAMTIPAHQSACHSYRVQTACDVFVWCFVAEAAIKLAGMGLTYFKSGFNCFDFVSGKGDFIHYVYLAIVVSGIIHTLSSFLMKLNCSLSPFCPSSTCILAALR
jgi:hypothetical protein